MMKNLFSWLVLVANAGAAAQEPGFAPPPTGTYRCHTGESNGAGARAEPLATLEIDGKYGYSFTPTGKSRLTGRVAAQPLGDAAKKLDGMVTSAGAIALIDTDPRSVVLVGLYVVGASGKAVFMLKKPAEDVVSLRCGEFEALRSARAPAGDVQPQPAPVSRRDTPPPRFATAPGQGLKPQQVVGFAQQIEYQGMSYSPLSGSWQGSHRVENYLLLADGSIRNGWPQDLPLEDYDAAASKREEPKLWGRYVARVKPGEGGYYDVTWNNGEQEKLALSFLVPARPDERLRGYFYQVDTASVGVAGNSTFSSAWSGIVLQPDGRFETNSGGSSNYQGSGGSVLATQARSRQGSYRLSGTLLELRFDDGRVDRRQFMFTSAEKDWIVVNGTRLLLRK